MLQSFLKLRATRTLLVRRTAPFTQVNALSYKTRMQRQYNDGIDLKQQSVEIHPTERIRQCSLHKDTDIWTFYKTVCPDVRTLGDALHEGYVVSNDGPCVGYLESSNGIDSLQWLSYSTVIQRSRYIGSYLLARTKLTPTKSVVAFLSSNRPEYLFVEQACYMYGFTVIGLFTTYDAATIQNVLQRTEAEVLVVDNLERIQSFQNELLNNTQIKEIIVLDEMKSYEKSKIRSLSSIFKTMKSTDICERPIVDPDTVATFIFTSGTTGNTENDTYTRN
jgi:long-chain acyl-CoA synthetase